MAKDTIPFQTERDLLIRLDTKVESLTGEVKDIKQDLIARMGKVEARLDAIDIINAGFKANIKLVGFLITIISAGVGAVAATVLAKLIH